MREEKERWRKGGGERRGGSVLRGGQDAREFPLGSRPSSSI